MKPSLSRKGRSSVRQPTVITQTMAIRRRYNLRPTEENKKNN